MLKRFIVSLGRSLTCFALVAIVGMLMGNDDWSLVAILTAMGALYGTFFGYEYGKLDQDHKRNNQEDGN